MPGPWSRTATSPRATATSTVAPGSLHLTALSSTLVTARSSRPGTPLTTVGSSVALKCDLRRKPGGALDRVLDEVVEPHVA